MGSVSNKAETGGHRRVKTPGPFKGVRMRTWVSEIRRPLSKERIWLGPYNSPEKAARAYDAALYCLRGPNGKFNFPDEERPNVPDSNPISSADIKTVAARFAAPRCMSPKCRSPECISAQLSASSLPTMISPEVPSFPIIYPPDVSPSLTTDPPEVVAVDKVVKPEMKTEGCDSILRAGSKECDAFPSESFLLDDTLTFEPDSIWTILEETKEFTDAK